MHYSSERKQLLHNVELIILLSHFEDSDGTVEELVEFHEVLAASRLVHELASFVAAPLSAATLDEVKLGLL